MKTLKDIAQLQTLAEAKLVLVLMRMAQVNSASLQEVAKLTGLPTPEVSQGAHLLKVIGVNVARDFDTVTLAEDWKINKAAK
jgi:hypothetical protein